MSSVVDPTLKKISVFGQPYNVFETPYECQFKNEVVKYCTSMDLEEMKCGKIVFIGDVGVGKTSIVQRFCHSMFQTDYKPTIGVDFDIAKFEILGTNFTLQLWDTAGQEKFKCLASSYYRSAHAIVIVFDVNKMTSLANCVNWYKSAIKEYSKDELPYVILVGNKIDSINSVAYDKIEGYAHQITTRLGGEFWPVSSKTGANITRLFYRIASLSFQSYVINEMKKDYKENVIGAITLHRKKSSIIKHQSCKNKNCQ